MFKYTFTLAAALYAGFVIWGDPQEFGGAEAATQTPIIATAEAGSYDSPAILDHTATDAVVTRAAVTETVVPDAASIAAATPSAAYDRPRLIGEPVVVSLVQSAGSAAPVTAEPAEDLMTVTGNGVNLRSGPSTGNPVIDSLAAGALAEPLGVEEDGWIEIRDVATGRTGFMAARFLSPS